MNTTDLLISLGVILILRLWQSGAIQDWVGKKSLTLPRWAQPVPPIALATIATVAVWLLDESQADFASTIADGGITGVITVGIYHVAKRWIPSGIVSKVGKVSAVGLVLLVGCAGQNRPSLPQSLAIAETAVLVTDAALAAAIDSLPDGEDLQPWAERVAALKAASDMLKSADVVLTDACAAGQAASTIAALIDCEPCGRAADAAILIACEEP